MPRPAERAASQRDDLPEETTGRHSAKRAAGAGRGKRRRFPTGNVGLAAFIGVVLVLFGVAAFVLPPSISGGGDDTAYDASLSGSDRSDLVADPAGARGAPRSDSPEAGGVAMLGDNPASPSATPSATPSAKPSRTAATPKATSSSKKSSNSGSSSGGSSSSGASDEIKAFENEVTAITNTERAANGCGKVTTDEKLRTAARKHSQDMAANNYFSHTGQNGSSPWDRAGDAGYDTPIGENIAKGQQTPESVMEAWMNSEGHRANILNCDAKEIGVGLAYDGGTPIWTQMFGAG